MRLTWKKDTDSLHTYRAETIRYRFILVMPRKGSVHLWVQHAGDDWGTNPIDQRACVSKRGAERIAQRFENARITPRRLR
jgi:hypothetical protein